MPHSHIGCVTSVIRPATIGDFADRSKIVLELDFHDHEILAVATPPPDPHDSLAGFLRVMKGRREVLSMLAAAAASPVIG